MKVFLNGGLIDADSMAIHVGDRGLTLGDGLFETMRAERGQVLRLNSHLARLRAGAAFLAIPLPLNDGELGQALGKVLDVNDLDAGVLRLTLTRGPAPRGLLPPADPRPTLLIGAGPLPPPAPPARALIATTRRNDLSPLSRFKTLGYLDNIIARQEAEAAGANEALLLNSRGSLAEATIANLFAVIDGRLVTPPVADGALPGVMRAEVMAKAQAQEATIWPADLLRASEAFLTSSMGIRPLLAVNGRKLGAGEVGLVTKRVTEMVG